MIRGFVKSNNRTRGGLWKSIQPGSSLKHLNKSDKKFSKVICLSNEQFVYQEFGIFGQLSS